MHIDLNLLPMFLTVAETQNFREAADRLGVTRSAVSQGVKRLEGFLGTQLVNRTTRAVALTEAGEALLSRLSRPMADIDEALESVPGTDSPRGHLKVAVSSIAQRFLAGPFIASFVETFPEITLDVTVTDEDLDIVAMGFDAGVRLGDVIAKDMIAVAITGDQREAVVASPGYIAAHGTPDRPEDLLGHRCIGWRPSHRTSPYRWEFEKDGQSFDIAVQPQITSNNLQVMLASALAGAGFTFATEETFQPYIQSGELVSVLESYLPPFPGFYLYFPQKTDLSPKLRALVDHTRHMRRLKRE